MSKERRNGVPIPGTPSAAAAVQDLIEGREPPAPVIDLVKERAAATPPASGGRRPATVEDILALRLHDANESILKLRNAVVDQATKIHEQEGLIAQLQGIVANLERDKYIRENNALRKQYGYKTDVTSLEEDLQTGQFFVVEKESPKPSSPASE